MVTYEQARQIAQRLLDERPRGPYVITGGHEYPVGWVFFWDSWKHQESGLRGDRLLGSAPILIDRETGRVHSTGTARRAEVYVAAYTERKRHLQGIWPASLDSRFLTLLALVEQGSGAYATWKLDTPLSTPVRLCPSAHPVSVPMAPTRPAVRISTIIALMPAVAEGFRHPPGPRGIGQLE